MPIASSVPSRKPALGVAALCFAFTVACSGGGADTAAPAPAVPQITTAVDLGAALVGGPFSRTLQATGVTPITWGIVTGDAPGLTLDPTTGTLSGTPTQAGTAVVTIQATNALGSATRQFQVRSFEAPALRNQSIPNATSGLTYDVTLDATGTGPFTWSITSGVLPSGLSLGELTGTLAGVPTASGSFPVTVRAANAIGSASRAIALTVLAGPTPPTITTQAQLTGAPLGLAYTSSLAANGSAPITWTVSSGSLPLGLALAGDGTISGVATNLGTTTFAITATNAYGSATLPCSIQVTDQPVVTSMVPDNAVCGGSLVFTGSGFGRTPGSNAVTIGGLQATLVEEAEDRLVVAVPHGLAGTATVQVARSSGLLATTTQQLEIDSTPVVFVDWNAQGANDGQNWHDAYVSLDDALQSLPQGGTIWLASGNYAANGSQPMVAAGGTRIFGGFRATYGSLAQRNRWHAYSTLYSATGDVRVIEAGPNCTLDTVSISGSNLSSATGPARQGAALFVANGSVTISACQLDGIGDSIVHVANGAVNATDTLFWLCDGPTLVAQGLGGTRVERCVFSGCTGTCVQAPQCAVTDCVFLDTQVDTHGMVVTDDGVVQSCTIMNTYGNSPILVCEFTGASTVVNTLFWRNYAGGSFVGTGAGGGVVMVSHCDVEGGVTFGAGIVDAGGNLAVDPSMVNGNDPWGPDGEFVTRDDGMMLTPGSPCIDAGASDAAGPFDITLTARPLGGGLDIGAYELQ